MASRSPLYSSSPALSTPYGLPSIHLPRISPEGLALNNGAVSSHSHHPHTHINNYPSLPPSSVVLTSPSGIPIPIPVPSPSGGSLMLKTDDQQQLPPISEMLVVRSYESTSSSGLSLNHHQLSPGSSHSALSPAYVLITTVSSTKLTRLSLSQRPTDPPPIPTDPRPLPPKIHPRHIPPTGLRRLPRRRRRCFAHACTLDELARRRRGPVERVDVGPDDGGGGRRRRRRSVSGGGGITKVVLGGRVALCFNGERVHGQHWRRGWVRQGWSSPSSCCRRCCCTVVRAGEQ